MNICTKVNRTIQIHSKRTFGASPNPFWTFNISMPIHRCHLLGSVSQYNFSSGCLDVKSDTPKDLESRDFQEVTEVFDLPSLLQLVPHTHNSPGILSRVVTSCLFWVHIYQSLVTTGPVNKLSLLPWCGLLHLYWDKIRSHQNELMFLSTRSRSECQAVQWRERYTRRSDVECQTRRQTTLAPVHHHVSFLYLSISGT